MWATAFYAVSVADLDAFIIIIIVGIYFVTTLAVRLCLCLCQCQTQQLPDCDLLRQFYIICDTFFPPMQWEACEFVHVSDSFDFPKPAQAQKRNINKIIVN